MRFVTITHPDLGTTTVPETRVRHLSDGWTVVDEAPVTAPADDLEPELGVELDNASPTETHIEPFGAHHTHEES